VAESWWERPITFGIPHGICKTGGLAGLYWVNREAALRLLDDLAEVGALVRLGAHPGRSVLYSCHFMRHCAGCPACTYLCADMTGLRMQPLSVGLRVVLKGRRWHSNLPPLPCIWRLPSRVRLSVQPALSTC